MEQIKKAFAAIKQFWNDLAPARRKLIITVCGVIVALAVVLTLYLNLSSAGYVVLYQNMEATESREVYEALTDMGLPARMSGGEVQVRRGDAEYAKAQLAIQNIPKTTLPYDIFDGAGGLTTTDFQMQQLQVQQLQNRLQDTIRQFDGISNAYVTLSIARQSNRVWESGDNRSTASVSVVLDGNVTLTRDQVSGIKYLVARSVGNGMQPADVAVIDAATSINLRSREDGDAGGIDAGLDRLGFEEMVEQRLVEKALNVLTLAYDPADIRVSATVVIDYNKMVTESKRYVSADSTSGNTGVLEHSVDQYVSDGAGLASGLVGEENNTDTPVYVDQDGDGQMDYIDNYRERDYAVGYILQQIEKDAAQLTSASLAITLRGEMDELTRSSIIENIARATNITEDRISVQNFMVADGTVSTQVPDVEPGISPTVLLILGGALLLLILILVLVMSLLGRKKKAKRTRQEPVREEGDSEAKMQMERELETRKRALQDSVNRLNLDNAVTADLKNFVHDNPAISASILRTWLTEEDRHG